MLKTIKNKVAIKPLEEQKEEIRESGLIIPEQFIQATQFGKITHVSEEEKILYVNDTVLYSRYKGMKIRPPEEKEQYIIMDASDVMCIVHPKEGYNEQS